VAAMGSRPGDENLLAEATIRDALICAAARNDRAFLIRRATTPVVAIPGQHEAVSDDVAALSSRVAEHFARGNPGESVNQVLAALAPAPDGLAAAIVGGLHRGWPRDA